MGITMFEIIDKEIGAIIDKQQLPSAFPSDCFPPKDVFNRMQDLWSLILRCWWDKPERRPQSWEVLEKIDNLITYPIYNNEHEEYITRYSTRGLVTGVCTYDDFLIP